MSAPLSQPASLDTVVEKVVQSPGMSIGLNASQLRTAWRALSVHVEDSLLRKKSTIVPGFCHFLLQEQVNHMGTWDTRSAWIPTVIPLQAFSSAYQLRNPSIINQAHVGAKVPTFLNGCAVAEIAQMPRNAVVHAIADIVRSIGTMASTGKRLQVDMGFCMLEFSQRKMSVRWSQAFLETFAEALGTATSHADRPKPKQLPRPSTAGTPPTVDTVMPAAAPNHEAAPATPTKAATVAFQNLKKSQQSVNKVPTPPPAPPKASAPVAASGSQRPQTARRPLAQEEGSRSTTPRRSGSTTPRRDGATPTSLTPSFSSSPRRSVSPRNTTVSPRMTKQDIDDIVNKMPKAPNQYHRRTAKKTLYRRMRNRAFEESWEAQMERKEREAEEERRRDKEKVDAFKRFLVESSEKEAIAKREKLEQGQKIDEVNIQLAEARNKLQLPSKCPPGDIFDSRLPTYTAAHDVETLKIQVQQRDQRRAREREEDRVHGKLASNIAKQAKEDEKALKASKRQTQAYMSKVYEAEINRQEREKREYQQSLTTGGALLFSGDDGLDLEKAEMNRVKQRTRDFQQENKRVMLSRNSARAQQARHERERNELSRQHQEASEQAFRAQQRREENARKADLRNTWTRQMEERKAKELSEKEHMMQWKEMNYLKNESSDDE